MATVLVSGVAGFIGSRVAAHLLARGDVVVGIDNLNTYYDVRLKDSRLSQLIGESCTKSRNSATDSHYLNTEIHTDRFHFYTLDVENGAEVSAIFTRYKFDAVYNLAARAGVRASIEDPLLYLRTNTLGTLNILEAMQLNGVSRLVLSSTSSLYAGHEQPFSEDMAVNTPLSPYAATKKSAEALAYSYHHIYGMNVAVVRYFTVYGPAGRPDMSIFRFIESIVRELPLELYGDGSQSRDFTFVEDVARGTVAAEKVSGFQIINIGGGRAPLSIREIIQCIEAGVGQKAKIRQKPRHAADMISTQADIAKAAVLLGWKPEVSFADGISETIAWHMGNREWVSQIAI